MRRPSHTELIREGEAQTEFNSNQLTIFRIDSWDRECAMARQLFNLEGLTAWLEIIKMMDSQLEGLLDKEERADLGTFRITYLRSQQQSTAYIYHVHKKLDAYHRRVRFYIQIKGLGVSAKEVDDISTAILR